MHGPSAAANGRHGRIMAEDRTTVRTRPTNNQLLYKAYFRWQHYPVANSPIYDVNETDACASVTAAFLQAMSVLQEVEALHYPTQRNVLKILSQDTRHTKVVNLACGTHRVSDELKKHYLTDLEGTQYTTNLDRNRYGADNQYMFTVIRHNLSALGLCPCLVDVEVLDQKSNETVMVSAGIEACTCEGPWREIKDQKMSCGGRSCSPGSSAHSEAKSSGKSTSFTQNALPRVCHKQSSIFAVGEAESLRNGMNEKVGSGGTSLCEINAALGLVSANRHLTQGPFRKARKAHRAVASITTGDLYSGAKHQQQSVKSRFRSRMDQEDTSGGFGKRTRQNDSGDGITWEQLQNATATQKSTNTAKDALGIEYKRVKSSFSQLSFDRERIMDEVLKMKSRLKGIDPLRYQIEEDSARIRRMEDELLLLKSEMRRYFSESRQVENQLHRNRRVISMLLNRLQNSLGNAHESSNDMSPLNPPSPLNSDPDGFVNSDAIEALVTQNRFQIQSGIGAVPNKATPPMPVPSMMSAMATHGGNGMNARSDYDVKWGFANSSSANTSAPTIASGRHPNSIDHNRVGVDDKTAAVDKRLSPFMNSKLDATGSPCAFHDVANVYEFNYGSV